MTALPCATSPERTAMFVGDGPKDDRESNWRYARQLCRSCPVLDTCRAMVLTDEANGVPHIGVAGGLLPSERKGAYKEPRPAPERPERPPAPMGRPPAPCGTDAARKRHQRNGETCLTCTPTKRWAHIPKVDKAPRAFRDRRRAELLEALRRTS